MITRNTDLIQSPFPLHSYKNISLKAAFHRLAMLILILGISHSAFAQNFEFRLMPEKPSKAFHIENTPIFLDISFIDSVYTQKSPNLFEGNNFDSHIHFSKVIDSFEVQLDRITGPFRRMKNTSVAMIPLQDGDASGTLVHIIHGEDPAQRQVTWIAIIEHNRIGCQIEGTYPLSMHPQLGRKFVTLFQSIHLDKG